MTGTQIIAGLSETTALWTLWCVVHYLLNSDGIIKRTGLINSWISSYYRLFYSLFAAASLMAVWTLTPREGSVDIWKWNGIFFAIRIIVIAVAVAVFVTTFRHIGLSDFLGFTAFGIGRKSAVTSNKLITTGIYGKLRHPQFAAGLLLLWARNLTASDLVINIVLSVYLIVGSKIEEKRLLRKFGERYAEYMESVPSFFPKII